MTDPVKPTAPLEAQKPDHHFEWAQIATALLSAKGIDKGLWRLSVNLRLAGALAQIEEIDKPTMAVPTGMVGFDSIDLFKAEALGPMVYDAALLVAPTIKRRAPPKKPAAVAPAPK